MVFEVRNCFEIAGSLSQVKSDAAMAGTFGDTYVRGSQCAKTLQSGVDQHGVSVDGGARIELYQVGLDHHALSPHIHAMLREQPPDYVIEALRVSGMHDGYTGQGPMLAQIRAACQCHAACRGS